MSKSGGVFQIDDVTRTMSKGGVRLVFHPSKFRPPHLLAGYGPAEGTRVARAGGGRPIGG